MNAMKRLLSLKYLLTGLLLAATTAAAAAAPPETFYRTAERHVYLEVAGDVASVGWRAENWKSTVLQVDGGSVMAAAQPAVDGAWLVRLLPVEERSKAATRPAKATRAQQRRELVAAAFETLRTSPEVEWIHPAYRSVETGTLLLPTPYLVMRTAPGVAADRILDELREFEEVRPLRGAEHQWRLRLADPRQDPLAVANGLTERFSWIEWAEPDFVWQVEYMALPNDPLLPQLWHLKNTGQGGGVSGADARLEAAWNVTTGNGSIVIAVIDDGVQMSHPDLAPRIFNNPGETANGLDDDGNGYVDDLHGWDFRQNDNDATPDLTGPGSHGTSVAGVAAAAGGNAVGGTGACWNCRILPVRISDDSTFVNNSGLAEAILYAASLADVLNNSWGGGSPSQPVMDAIDSARASGRGGKGAPVLFANGNSATGYTKLAIGFAGVPAGNYTFEWDYVKDESVDAGFDTAWIDNVTLPDGSFENFEGCSALPAGWSTGAFAWTAVNDATRAASRLGGACAIGAGATSANEVSFVNVSRYITGAAGSKVEYDAWVSSERNNSVDGNGNGPIVVDDCYDFLGFFFRQGTDTPVGPIFPLCGTFSNQGNPLRDGILSFPSAYPVSISVGAASNFDRRSGYAQWGLDMNGQPGIDFVAHSDGGSVAITAPDIVGNNGYSTTNYTETFGGTSSATPLASGIVGLLLTAEPNLTYDQVRTRLRQATRKIGNVTYTAGYHPQYGYGALDAGKLLTASSSEGLIFRDGFESGNTSKWSAP